MTPAFLIMLIVVVPCVLVLGVLVGWDRGRDHAEQSLAQLDVNDHEHVTFRARADELVDAWRADQPIDMRDMPTIDLTRCPTCGSDILEEARRAG